MNATLPTEKKPSSIWSRTFITICIVSFFQITGQQMATAVIPLYARDFGLSAGMIGFIVGAFAITALATRPFMAPAFDIVSKKKIWLASQAVIILSLFLYGFASDAASLTAVRMLHGLAMAAAGPMGLSLATMALPSDRLAYGISFFGMGQALAMAIGPAFGLYLVGVVGYHWTFWLSSIAMAIALVLLLSIKDPSQAQQLPYRIKLNRIFAREAVLPTVLSFICITCNSTYMAFIAIYGQLLGVAQVGLFFTVQAACMVATRPLLGKIADRHGYAVVVVPGLCFFALSFYLVSVATTLQNFLIAAVVSSLGFGAISPLFNAMAMSSVPYSRSGAASATNFTGVDLGQLVGPSVFGLVAEYFEETSGSEVGGYSSMYAMEIIGVIGALVIFAASYRRILDNIQKANS
ncbi:MAG: MFS transporter [Eggerthellaceae bacterium]|jgi:MFS family permease